MLKGSQVILRPVQRSDIPSFLVWFNDPEITQYLTVYLPMTEMSEEKWVENLAVDFSKVNFVVETIAPGGNRPIGSVGIENINSKDRDAEFGIVIGNKDCWNQGYGTESAALIIRYAFEQLNLNRVSSRVYDFNPRSQRMHLKLGFKEEGRRRQAKYVNGQYHDVFEYGLLRSDWETTHQRQAQPLEES
jgi:RimJ/RimL family protein N-acetyltransferase